jgi:hypothetical protein
VDVCAKPHVVGEIPTIMIGVFVDHDVIAVPVPITAVARVKWRYAEIEAAEPKAAGTASGEMPNVSAAETSCKAAVFPRVVEVEAGVVASLIVPDPLAVVVNVRGFRVSFLIAEGAVRFGLMGCTVGRRRPMTRHVSAAHSVASTSPIMMLRERG